MEKRTRITEEMGRAVRPMTVADISNYTAKEYMMCIAGAMTPISLYFDAQNRPFAPPYEIRMINTLFGLAGNKLSSEISLANHQRVDGKTRMVSIEKTLEITRHLVGTGGRIKVLFEGKVNLPIVAAIMMVIPGFTDAYENYLMQPDDSVIIGEGAIIDGNSEFDAELLRTGYELTEGIATSNSFSKGECYAFAYIMVIFMGKKLVNLDQYSKVIEARTRAMCMSIGMSDIDINKLKDRLIFAEMQVFADKMAFFPKFKVLVHKAILLNAAPFNRHMRTILKESQMTIFNFIHYFLSHPTKTQLHICFPVLRETRMWLMKYQEIKDMYEEDWLYFKLLEPTSTLSSTVELPNLANAAISFIHVHKNTSSQSNIQGRVKVVPAYVNLARKLMPSNVLDEALANSANYQSLAEEFTRAGLSLGYKINEAIENNTWDQIVNEDSARQ